MSKNANYQNKNRKRAYEYFGLTVGNTQGLVLHHKDPDLIVKDIDRYNEWRPEDLVVLTREEHAAIHHTGRKRPDWVGKKISEARKGKKRQGHWYKNEATVVNLYILPGDVIPDGFVLGRIMKPETRAKISKTKMGSVPWNKGKCGYMSEEAKASIREKKTGKLLGGNNPCARKVEQYDLQGELIRIWDALSDIQRELGIDRRKIGLACKGQRYKTYKGYIWKYKE